MRPIQLFNKPPSNAPLERKVEWIMDMLDRIVKASQEDTATIADSFEITNATPNRTLDSGTATLAQVAQVVATFLSDMKKRGMNRAAG
jgi:Holliday junction resolvasome RuvABC endonuclease subunit